MIQGQIKEAFDRQRSYTDLKQKNIEFNIDDKMFLKVSPWRKVLQFGQKGKLTLRFIGPYEILERIGPLAYRLALSSEMKCIHNVFHVSMLRRYHIYPPYVIPLEQIKMTPDITYVDEPIMTMA
ncbi:uncharacterized protein LOC120142857 [Hibiscus syriacus]|uniref:uncharacterized protein LOC120142857 n=1 Tax=Hibiscus syriacus TaxID=106335 RepID=UPI001921E76E|nr:uncharacterized protein LOC120142857 [Hibiscus syriacus]